MVTLAATVLAGATAPALPEPARSLNFYGVPGTIDMPSGESAADGLLSVTHARFGDISRTTLSFQFSPRISASFRYSRLKNFNDLGFGDYYDRSFDLRFRLFDEGRYLPALTVGLQDLAGTGLSSAEYIVATKNFGDRLKISAGLGWGRLGSSGALGTPFGTRPDPNADLTGGSPDFGTFFRGPVAPFGGVEYAFNDKLTFKLEYSSDAYESETAHGLIDRKSPVNLGAEYAVNRNIRLGAYYLYGSTVGFAATFSLNPKNAPFPGTLATAPLPVKPRDRAAVESWGTEWTQTPQNLATLRNASAKAVENEGMHLEAMAITGTSATLRIRNPKYDAEPMAIGRVMRALTYILPPSVETFTVVPVVNGIPTAAISLRRTDIESLENTPDGTQAILNRADIRDLTGRVAPGDAIAGAYPRFAWSIGPSLQYSLFDPGSPLLYQIGVRASARYDLAPGLVLSGSLRQKITGNYDQSDRESNSVLPHVRSDSLKYAQQGTTAIEKLQLAYYFRPGPNLYGRITGGYLEQMFAGISTELLWKPVDSRLAFGVEADYVRQRAYYGGFGLRDYGVATGHVSAYYDFGGGYHTAVHVGRYLAGDYGATLELDREFANGWKIGAFATKTDVSAQDFGEGSFDKGITVRIPLSWFIGQPTRQTTGLTLRPLTRDGGARLNVDGRLYDSVRDYHAGNLAREWGLFWR